MRNSDYALLRSISLGERIEKSSDRYKACVFEANTGGRSAIEDSLRADERELLEWRRRIFAGSADLRALAQFQTESRLLQGDQRFLMAVSEFGTGDWSQAKALLSQARDLYAQAGEDHRLLRTQINAHICEASLSSYLAGPLRMLKTEAHGCELWDLVGNFHKALAIEFLRAEQWLPASLAATDAIENYERLGCPEDLDLARAVRAIALFVSHQKPEAQLERARISLVHGKVASYLNIYDSLIAGKRPRLAPSHTLAQVRWPLASIKTGSLSARISALLQSRALDKDELCRELWGDQAFGPIYYGRLFTAINALRKDGLPVHFDGARYHFLKSHS